MDVGCEPKVVLIDDLGLRIAQRKSQVGYSAGAGEIALNAPLLDHRVSAPRVLRRLHGEKLLQKSSERGNPSAPASMRMIPTVLMLNPYALTLTAKGQNRYDHQNKDDDSDIRRFGSSTMARPPSCSRPCWWAARCGPRAARGGYALRLRVILVGVDRAQARVTPAVTRGAVPVRLRGGARRMSDGVGRRCAGPRWRRHCPGPIGSPVGCALRRTFGPRCCMSSATRPSPCSTA
jgi:hypothetical protein